MRIVFVGAGDLTVMTARLLVKEGHDVVVVEREMAVIDALRDELDAGFLHGDGTKPNILREAAPEESDFLFCLTRHAQENIIASLVGRELGFPRVVTSIDDPEFEGVCRSLGLDRVIVPSRTIGRYLADMIRGVDVLELSTLLRGDARFFSFVATAEDAVGLNELELPEETAVACLYRGSAFKVAAPDLKLREGDEVVLVTHARNLPSLRDRWGPTGAKDHARPPAAKGSARNAPPS